MTHFTVVPNTGLNRVIKHRFRLLFQYNTSVVSVVSPRIPHLGLCLASMDEIDQMTKDHNFLIDFVGIITGVRKERDVASDGKLVKAVVLEVFADGYISLTVSYISSYLLLILIFSSSLYFDPFNLLKLIYSTKGYNAMYLEMLVIC
ncbi:hypothetical protein Ahy_A04g020461 [Arachis hypogaea]|uniref:DUF223 domain-containing protein n=1 Tax=Arachis hypogaea TaxID=3818 RepID=A0A445DHZ4_ARAHY|nr:hypothetical protein Ahy_A04g020461 [Arachis hypogaea]